MHVGTKSDLPWKLLKGRAGLRLRSTAYVGGQKLKGRPLDASAASFMVCPALGGHA